MSVKIGISPISWQNDDLPDLTAAYTMEQALQEAREIGYTGVERGRRMPSDTEGLGRYLTANGLFLCGGWCSGNLLTNDVKTEIEAVRQQAFHPPHHQQGGRQEQPQVTPGGVEAQSAQELRQRVQRETASA